MTVETSIRYSLQLMGYFLFRLLIDWKNSESSYWKKLEQIAFWIDQHVFGGHRFVGREWNRTEFVFNKYEGESSQQKERLSISDLPPPSKAHGRRLCLDPEYLARPEWSSQTVSHIVAVDFCYIMLREAQLRKKAKNRPVVSQGKASVELLQSPTSPGNESVGSTASEAADLPWIDVGTKIGLRLLNSAHVQRAMNPENAEKILQLGDPVVDGASSDPLSPNRKTVVMAKPVHSMWTSPAAAAIEESMSPVSTFSESTHRARIPPSGLLFKSSPDKMSSQSRNTTPNVKSTHDGAFGTLGEDLRLPDLDDPEKFPQFPLSNSIGSLLVEKVKPIRREPLKRGMKVAISLSSADSILRNRLCGSRRSYQMGTVETSKRLFVGDRDHEGSSVDQTNALSIRVKLDRSYLRNGEFMELTCRVLDTWPDWCMPRHSKVPIGSCVATSFGLGILVSWRVEDDCHVVRSLWQKRGSGSAHAYLQRNAIHEVVEASIGFQVKTKFGSGDVIAYVDGGHRFQSGQYIVVIRDSGRRNGHVVEMNRSDILSCKSAQFIPVIEHIREAAHYQIQLDNYRASMREGALAEVGPSPEQKLLKSWSTCAEILWKSFLKSMETDADFNAEVNDFMSAVIQFLDKFDEGEDAAADIRAPEVPGLTESVSTTSGASTKTLSITPSPTNNEPGLWLLDDIFGGFLGTSPRHDTSFDQSRDMEEAENIDLEYRRTRNFKRGYAVVNLLLRTISTARAASADHPHFRMALAIFFDFLLFIRTVVKVQETNTSVQQIKLWRRSFDEIVAVFGPIKDRIEKIGLGIAQRLEKQGREAKVRLIRFVDIILSDDGLLIGVEQADWEICLKRIEKAMILSGLIEEKNVVYYRKTFSFVFDQIERSVKSPEQKKDNLQAVARFAQWLATPRRSLLKLIRKDDTLDLVERILVRAFEKEELASRMLVIHASNFQSLRHLRMLKDFSTSGSLWMPLLDAADEEFSWLVSQMPENSKDFMCPLSSLFSLCVAQFRCINDGDLSKDWLDFLLQEEAVRIVQEIDMKAILAVESFAKDVKETMTSLPYYATIDEDILNLVDEVDLNEFLKETSEAIDNPETLTNFLREKATIAIERFLVSCRIDLLLSARRATHIFQRATYRKCLSQYPRRIWGMGG